jgi:DNA processing protein
MTDSDLPWLAALAALGSGSDTRSARVGKQLRSTAVGQDLLTAVAERLWASPSDRRRHIDRARRCAEQALRSAATLGYGALSWAASAYPALLMEIVDPPPLLWVRGDGAALLEAAVAIVGARAASPTSLAVGRQLARGLAEAGLCTVSGMARGVDGAAHEGALEAGGSTVAVLGCGPDVVYPPEHQSLACRIEARGAIVSEFAPGTRPYPGHFPLRNRVISGLSRAVVVIEASDRSGSLITARSALEQGRDVLAVPGNPLSGRHRGGHALIKDGARLVETVGDVLEEIGWRRPVRNAAADQSKPLLRSDLESMMAPGDVYTVEDLADQSGRPVAEILAELGQLEVEGLVKRTEGGSFLKLD